MKRIKWIEDKSQDFRGNHSSFAFTFDNSSFIFEWNAYMTYKTFRAMVRRMAVHYGASIVTVCEPWQGTQQEHVDDPDRIIVRDMHGYADDEQPSLYGFYKELVVAPGERRQQKEYDEAVIFPNTWRQTA